VKFGKHSSEFFGLNDYRRAAFTNECSLFKAYISQYAFKHISAPLSVFFPGDAPGSLALNDFR